MDEKYLDLFKYVAETEAECANSVLYALELLDSRLEQMLEQVNAEIGQAAKRGSYSDVQQIAQRCEYANTVRSEVKEVISCLANSESRTSRADGSPVSASGVGVDPYSSSVLQDSSKPPSAIPDRRTERDLHRLDEDFEHTKICALIVEPLDIKIQANSWKDALVQLVGILMARDREKMIALVEKGYCRGRFLLDFYVPGKNKLVPGTDLYVWTNNSANRTAKLIINILKAYGVSVGQAAVKLVPEYKRKRRVVEKKNGSRRSMRESSRTVLDSYERKKLEDIIGLQSRSGASRPEPSKQDVDRVLPSHTTPKTYSVISYHVVPVSPGRAAIQVYDDSVITNNILNVRFFVDSKRGERDNSFEVHFIDEKGRALCDRQKVEVVNGRVIPERLRFCLTTHEDSGSVYDLLIHEQGKGETELAARIHYKADVSFKTEDFGL